MSKALVVLSGGQDSTTCLYWAKARYDEIFAVTFDYGQRHSIEIEAAKAVAKMAGVVHHQIVKVGPILEGTSPLTNPNYQVEQYKDVESLPGGLEKTFVPGRNILFLTLAANRAYCLGADAIVTGVAQEDFGGYPDCREDFIKAMEYAVFKGLDCEITIETPLMHLSKRGTVDLARSLPGCMDALAHSHTCYNGHFPPCGKCHACLLRQKGFDLSGYDDPLELRAALEG